MADEVCFNPIGVIHSPFHSPAGMPVQSTGARDVPGSLEIFPAYQGGLADISGFERIILLYVFHQTEGWSPMVTPYLDTHERGVFSTRAPRRPNRLGISTVRVSEVRGCTIDIIDIDVLDGTPLLDIKPYIPKFDSFPDSYAGWLETAQNQVHTARADRRFHSDTIDG